MAVLLFQRLLYIVKQLSIVRAPCCQRVRFRIKLSFQRVVQIKGMVILRQGKGIVQKMQRAPIRFLHCRLV